MRTVAVFGGTFDPIHNGHLHTSLAIQREFNFDSYRFLPCKIPTIKPPALANNDQRIAMVELAIKPYEFFELDLREIQRDSPSYTVNTLLSLREEEPEASITLILGYDAFISLPQWYQWERILELAHVLVMNRDASNYKAIPELIEHLLKTHKSNNKQSLLTKKSGAIYEFNAGDYPISSTEIRAALKNHLDVSAKLPKEVYDYIKTQALYL
jgi:nicotinate-nucleotide adenylyltransferase